MRRANQYTARPFLTRGTKKCKLMFNVGRIPCSLCMLKTIYSSFLFSLKRPILAPPKKYVSWHGYPLRNTCVTDNHGYVLFLLVTMSLPSLLSYFMTSPDNYQIGKDLFRKARNYLYVHIC